MKCIIRIPDPEHPGNVDIGEIAGSVIIEAETLAEFIEKSHTAIPEGFVGKCTPTN